MTSVSPRNTRLRARLAEALDDLPVFPLPNVALFPGARLALHIFEPRYRAMLAHCLEGHGCMAVAQLREGAGQPAAPPEFAAIAGVGIIVQHQPLPDGRSNIMLEGLARVRLDEKAFTPPFRRARAEILADLPDAVSSTDVASLVIVASRFATLMRENHPDLELSVPSVMDGGELADLLSQELVLDPRDRQQLLETLEPSRRVRALLRILAAQWEALRPREQTSLSH
jgi:Lon protease-like protein